MLGDGLLPARHLPRLGRLAVVLAAHLALRAAPASPIEDRMSADSTPTSMCSKCRAPVTLTGGGRYWFCETHKVLYNGAKECA